MKIVYKKVDMFNHLQPTKIQRYCCEPMKKWLQVTYDPFTILDDGKLVIQSYDFSQINDINYCMSCGEKIELVNDSD